MSWTSLGYSLLFLAPLSCYPLICSETVELHMVASSPDVLVILDDTGDRFISGEVVVMRPLLEMSLTCHARLTNEFNLPSTAYSAAWMPWSSKSWCAWKDWQKCSGGWSYQWLSTWIIPRPCQRCQNRGKQWYEPCSRASERQEESLKLIGWAMPCVGKLSILYRLEYHLG